MNDQPAPLGPAGPQTTGAGRGDADPAEPGLPAGGPYGKLRQGYLDPRGSESTRGMRDTARRRRDAEEKLQQHLLEAKDHIPNEHAERSAADDVAPEGEPVGGVGAGDGAVDDGDSRAAAAGDDSKDDGAEDAVRGRS